MDSAVPPFTRDGNERCGSQTVTCSPAVLADPQDDLATLLVGAPMRGVNATS